MQAIKNLFKKYEIAIMLSDAADKAWENDPENEQAEINFDAAYKKEWDARRELAKAIKEFTKGAIDQITAERMTISKYDELKSLVARIA